MRAKHEPKPKRTEQLLQAALAITQRVGLDKLTREAIAAECGVTPGLVNEYLGTMISVRRDVIRHAVKNEILPIICEAIMRKSPHVARISDDLRERAINTLRVQS